MLDFLLLRKSPQSPSELATRLASQYLEVLGKRFSNLSSLMEKHIHDPRKAKGKKYSLPDLLISTISMFALQQDSRHSYNQDRLAISKNFRNVLKVKLAHGDTCEDLLRKVNPEQINCLLAAMVSGLIESKVFAPFRYQGKYLVAIDATGVHSFSDNQQGTALSKTSKNDVVSYSSAVLEAKLVGENGFAISLCQEWIGNVGASSNKQDCEQNAFVRLSKKLKILYPRLPMILLGDALYMSDPVVNRCKENQWDFIIVQKNNGSDYTREEIELRPDKIRIQKHNEYFEYLNELDYNKHRISWLSYRNYATYFAWYTSLKIEAGTLEALSTIARSRWKIENQGFDQQKNHGYNLQHQHSRISPTARYNYYILLQIAHLINQLVLLELRFKAGTKKCTRKKIWEYFRAFLQNPIPVLTMLRHYCTRKQHIYKE